MAGAVAAKIDNIKAKGGIKSRDVAQLLNTTPQTVSRWQQGRSAPHRVTLDRLLKLDWLAEQLSQIYEPDEARVWLFSPHPQLEGARPADLIIEDRDDEVLKLIDQLQSAAHI